MTEWRDSRRRRLEAELGVMSEEERDDIKFTIQQEQQRVLEKKELKDSIDNGEFYGKVLKVAKIWDKYWIDPLLGFFLPGTGDILCGIIAIPLLHLSIFKIRSAPLTLAILYRTLIDCLIGLIPIGGDIFDAINRSFEKSANLICDFLVNEEEAINKANEVNRKYRYIIVIIGVLIVSIYLIFSWIGNLFGSLFNFISGLF